MSQIINIPEVEKQYQDEWLLFEVLEVDEKHQPIKGKLLLHSKDRGKIHKKAVEYKCKHDYVTYTGDPIPKGWGVVV
ncbi:MAG: hypothetical protein QME81_17225 [bacterium]|nr:hypothetical protein [bacterium]